MTPPTKAPDLKAIQNSVAVAAAARQQEFKLYNQARTDQDVRALTVHFQGYQKALQVEQKANEILEQNLLSSPELTSDLKMLTDANKQLEDAATNLKSDAAALNSFTEAANGVLTVLGIIAAL